MVQLVLELLPQTEALRRVKMESGGHLLPQVLKGTGDHPLDISFWVCSCWFQNLFLCTFWKGFSEPSLQPLSPSCLSFPGAGVIDVYHCAQLIHRGLQSSGIVTPSPESTDEP